MRRNRYSDSTSGSGARPPLEMAPSRRVFVAILSPQCTMKEHHERQEMQTFQARQGWSSVADGPAHGRPRARRSSDTPHLPRRRLTILDYGLSLVALSRTVGCADRLAARISRHSGALVSACCAPTEGLPATTALGDTVSYDAVWPGLVALLLGPFAVLLAGFGGWV